MRRAPFALSALATAGALACGSDDPVRSNEVVTVIIVQGSQLSVDALGPLRLDALGLNALNEEVEPGTFRWHWHSTDPSIAAVTDEGMVTVLQNGTVRIWAAAFQASDTITLVIEQRATRVTLEQDTIVALTPDAQRLGTLPIPTTEMRVVARPTDANGNPIASADPITWINLTPEYFSITPNASGDTLRINGTAAGAAASAPGQLRVQFREYTATLPVQVSSKYAAVRITTTAAGTGVSPSSVSIPVGGAVVFFPADAALVRGTGWKTGLIPSGGLEAQMFSQVGTYQFQVGSGTGTVIVGP